VEREERAEVARVAARSASVFAHGWSGVSTSNVGDAGCRGARGVGRARLVASVARASCGCGLYIAHPARERRERDARVGRRMCASCFHGAFTSCSWAGSRVLVVGATNCK